jgi:hypothetical protein
MRKLASIRRVGKVERIENADRIELAHVDGWQVVVKREEFREGDLGIYFEIDSKLPDQPQYEFMRSRGFKVKTIKLRGVLSQGLLLPLPKGHGYTEGENLTSALGITKIGDELPDTQEYKKRARKVQPWWARLPLLRRFWRKEYRGFPMYLRKTDEERVQNLSRLGDMISGEHLYYTEKLDGQSVTIFFNRLEKSGWWTRGVFGVCSRNIPYWERTNNNWWNAAVQSELHRTLPDYCRNHKRSLAIQGEIVGPGIQGNKYVLGAQKLFVFSIWDIEAQRYVSYGDKRVLCAELNLSLVPTCGFLPPDSWETEDPREFFLELAKDYSSLNPAVLREGIVVRGLHREHLSFKAINNDFLLRYDHG